MARGLTLLAALTGCGSGKVGAVPDGAVAGDTGATAADGGGTDDSGDTGGDTAEAPAVPTPDWGVWQAELRFSYDTWGDAYDCAGDTMAETGEALTSGATFEEMAALCPSCTLFYETAFERTTVCDWIDLPEGDLRGVSLGEDWAAVYRFDQTDAGLTMELMDSNAAFDGWSFTFEYTFSYWVDVDVVGVVTWPEADAR
jgi:hypothetical protein